MNLELRWAAQMNLQILEPTSEDEAELNAFLDARIYEFNVQATGFSDGKPFSSIVKDEGGNIIAAISGHTWGGCCHIVHLWVHDLKRRQGIGSALLQSVEKEAALRGCTQSLVTTHSFQAPIFYERHGYVRQASISDYPRSHAQYVYIKRLPSN